MWCYMRRRSGERVKKMPLQYHGTYIYKIKKSQGQATSFKVMFDLKEKKRFEVKTSSSSA